MSVDEMLATLTVRSRQEEALRHAAIRQAVGPRPPINVTLAAALRNLADRMEPTTRPNQLVHP